MNYVSLKRTMNRRLVGFLIWAISFCISFYCMCKMCVALGANNVVFVIASYACTYTSGRIASTLLFVRDLEKEMNE
jgi:hypothetical protein